MVLVSPSLWWDDNVSFKYKEAYAASHKSLPLRIFMSMGEQMTDVWALCDHLRTSLQSATMKVWK